VRLAEAPSHGLPVVHYDKRAQGTQAYLALANEVLRKYEQGVAEPQSANSDSQEASAQLGGGEHVEQEVEQQEASALNSAEVGVVQGASAQAAEEAAGAQRATTEPVAADAQVPQVSQGASPEAETAVVLSEVTEASQAASEVMQGAVQENKTQEHEAEPEPVS
jgi:hypothetical protein